jgi:beta-RFAP synthase
MNNAFLARCDRQVHSAGVEQVLVTAPSRLHFGMLSFGQPGVRQFGGIGVMVAPPLLRLAISKSPQFAVAGPSAARIRRAATSVCRFLALDKPPNCHIQLQDRLHRHVGLGSGTQLALAVALGLHAFLGQPAPDACDLARMVGRAARSAVGTYGFALGGLVLEGGKLAPTEIAPLIARVDLPQAWRFVLFRPRRQARFSGGVEEAAFGRLPAVDTTVTDRLCRIALDELLPAARDGLFEPFADAVCRYGELAGSCFAAVQGGPFNGPQTTQLVERLCRLGARGVGQSSWGPTVFAAAADQHSAQRLVERFRAEHGDQSFEIVIAAPASRGATVVIS